MDAHPPIGGQMKNLNLSTAIFYEVIVYIAVVSLILLCMYKCEIKHNKIEIEEFPITYQQNSDICSRAIEQDETEKVSREVQEKLNEINNIEDKKGWYLSYKDLIDSYSDVLDSPENVYDYYTEDEIYLIQRCVETECYGGDFDSKCNVASVIFNRINSNEFNDDVTNVITAKNQFAYWRRNISEDTKLAIEYAFTIEDTTNGCIAFHSNEKRNKFNNWNYVFTDSIGHHFYA